MWIVKMVLWVLIMLFLVYFASENTQQEVQVQFWKWESQPLQLWLVMFMAFASGVLFLLAGSIIKMIQFKNDIRKLRKENKRIASELDQLRSVSLEEETDFSNKNGTEGKQSNDTLLLP